MADRQGAFEADARTLPMNLGTDYTAAWTRYGRRRALAIFMVFGCVPVVVGMFLLSRLVIHLPVLSLMVMAAWLAGTVAAVWWAGEFRCPRCRRRFGAQGSNKGVVTLWRGIFDKICGNCKIRKFERH